MRRGLLGPPEPAGPDSPAFIAVFEVLGAMGKIQPILGAALHFVAATVVIFNSARLVRFGEELHKEPAPPAPKPRVAPEPVPAT